MATHSNILVWRIPWTEKPGGSQRVGHDLAANSFTAFFFFFFEVWRVVLFLIFLFSPKAPNPMYFGSSLTSLEQFLREMRDYLPDSSLL